MPDDSPDPGSTYTVRDDDCMSSIAAANGFFWQTLWDHAKNADLKSLRKNPNVLNPGDSVYIPPLTPKKIPDASDARYKFLKKGTPALARFRFLQDGQPRANTPCVVHIDDKTLNLTTDADGLIKVPIDPQAQGGRIHVGTGKDEKIYKINLGSMDPVATDSGLRKRLRTLGFDPKTADEDADGTLLAQALRRFQSAQKLPLTGQVSDSLRDKLVSLFGC